MKKYPVSILLFLSSRELQILHYMLNGYGTIQIADTLNITMSNVSLYEKQFIKRQIPQISKP